MTLAVVCGIFLAGIISSIISLLFLGVFLGAASAIPSVQENSVLKIDMSRITLAEQTQESLPSMSFGVSMVNMEQPEIIGIWDAVRALDAAAEDPKIKCVYLKTDGMSSGIASLEEFRKALLDFRKSGKPVLAYTENPTTGSCYLASVADRVYTCPYLGGAATINGVGGRMVYYKELLDKLGINVQLIRHGKYKSAGEPFIRTEPSQENMEQQQVMLNSIWKSLSGKITESRDITVAQLDSSINNLAICTPEDLVRASLADGVLTRDSLEIKLAELAEVEDFDKVNMVTFADYVASKAEKTPKAGNKLAIIFASGEIVDGDGLNDVAGDRFAAEIEKVRKDNDIKVVVLRVNSPGGSVLASEKIKAELDLLQESKTLIASYGDYAASGGYWISNACGKIFTDETTLTGSIGVFGMVPDVSGAYKNILHLNSYPVSTHKHTDMFSLMRPFDADEYAYMQRNIEGIYDKFLANVAAGREMTKEAVDEIAQGRVWTGSDAKGIGLVDEIGTLKDAVLYAIAQAGEPDLSKWSVAQYPAPLTIYEQFMEMFGEKLDKEGVMMRKLEFFSKPRVLARAPYEFVME